MKFHYYQDTDSLYISLADCPSANSDEVVPGIVLDFDDQGNLVGIDIEHASMTVNLSKVELISFPFPSPTATRTVSDGPPKAV